MDRRKMALECLEVERIGYSVLDFLREQGAISPWGTWWRLQVEELGRARYQIRDGKENKMAKKNVLTPEVRTDAEKMIEAGRDPKQIQAYLAEHGSKNPSAHLYAIKNSVKKKAGTGLDSGHPGIKQKDELAGFEPFVPEKKTVAFNGKEFEKTEGPSPTCCQPARPSGVTVPDQLPEKKPSFKIREAEGASGVWRNNGNGWITYTHNGEQTKMRVEDWMVILTEFPNVMELFGVKEAGTGYNGIRGKGE
jgi:hypothetical protein